MFKFFARKKSDPYAASDQHLGDGGEGVAAAGLNMDSWDVVQVHVPPGPLGIVLDGNCLSAAVVDEFSPLPDGRKGAIEAHGGVHRGSVLMSVNEFDLLADKMTLMEVGHVLRETSHLERIMRFKVPPQPETGGDQLHPGMSLEKQSLLSRMMSSSSSSIDLLQSTEPVAALRKPSVTDANLLTVTVKGPKLEPPVVKHFIGGKFVAVDVPPGPLGLNLDGAVHDHGVVLGFIPLPDGSKGALESHGGVKIGSVLIEINDENVSKMPLDALRAKLGALSGSPRRLVFRLPASSSAASKRQSQATEHKQTKTRNVSMVKMHVEEDLEKRRKLELALVLKFDKSKIKRSECWFMVDTQWMARWVAFVGQGGPLPGTITNENLLLPEWRDRLNGEIPGEPDTPRPGLERSKDFRCVNPMVWSILSELHGAGDIPVIARYVEQGGTKMSTYDGHWTLFCGMC